MIWKQWTQNGICLLFIQSSREGLMILILNNWRQMGIWYLMLRWIFLNFIKGTQIKLIPFLVRVGYCHLSVGNRMTDCQVPLTSNQNSEEHRGTETHVVERIGELWYQIHPHQAVFWPGPGEHWNKVKYQRKTVMWKNYLINKHTIVFRP